MQDNVLNCYDPTTKNQWSLVKPQNISPFFVFKYSIQKNVASLKASHNSLTAKEIQSKVSKKTE